MTNPTNNKYRITNDLVPGSVQNDFIILSSDDTGIEYECKKCGFINFFRGERTSPIKKDFKVTGYLPGCINNCN